MRNASIHWTLLGLLTALALPACQSAAAPGGAGALALPRAPSHWPSLPFRRRGHEPFVEHPCGPEDDDPCIALSFASINMARGYQRTAWFLLTDGSQLTYEHSWQQETDVYQVADGLTVTPAWVSTIRRASTRLPGRVPAEQVGHALSLLEASREGRVRQLGDSACDDAATESVTGFLFDRTRGAFTTVEIQTTSCWQVLSENDAPAARELARWVQRLRGGFRDR